MQLLILSLIVLNGYCIPGQGISVSRHSIVGSIRNGTDWKSIKRETRKVKKLNHKLIKKVGSKTGRRYVRVEYKSTRSDVKETIKYLKNIQSPDVVDSFFIEICDTVYSRFPFRMSGRLNDNLYKRPKIDTVFGAIPIRGLKFGKNATLLYVDIVMQDFDYAIPRLIAYLDSDAATRLVIGRSTYGGTDYYLSISDVAMELLEIITYCDFYDNASNEVLFSNLETEKKDALKAKIASWYLENEDKDRLDQILVFLDNATGHSYEFTCRNLAFLGYEDIAKDKLVEYFNKHCPQYSEETVNKRLREILKIDRY
ncbi:MAG: hypothetical protein DRI69_02825 [Bacteroidetes bacterium]|nr:MAG: hypothetical protein DRI69_02825 [Bacteroidota bacterium]